MKKKINKIKKEFQDAGFEAESGDECFIPLKFYDDGNGNFDYDNYKELQNGLNKQKIGIKGPSFNRGTNIVKDIQKNIKNIKFGLCHGSRRGDEQNSLSKALYCEVLGTDIADSATDFPNSIQWDFHEIKDEWIDNVSFIYTNSIDHAYDPIRAIRNWMKCLHVTGCIYIELGEDKDPHKKSKRTGKKLRYASEDWTNPKTSPWLKKEKYDGKLTYNLADCFRCTHKFIEEVVKKNSHKVFDGKAEFKVESKDLRMDTTIIRRLK